MSFVYSHITMAGVCGFTQIKNTSCSACHFEMLPFINSFKMSTVKLIIGIMVHISFFYLSSYPNRCIIALKHNRLSITYCTMLPLNQNLVILLGVLKYALCTI